MNASAVMNRPQRAWLTIDDFLLLEESGAFDKFSKTELIDGEIIALNSQFIPHAYVLSELMWRFQFALRAIETSYRVFTGPSVAMPPYDMPEPDLVLTDATLAVGPVPLESVALAVEVASTTRTMDLGRKAAVYARHRVPEYWVFDLEKREIVRHRDPDLQGYMLREKLAFGSALRPLLIPEIEIETDGLLI